MAKKVLLVDDELEMVEMVSLNLTTAGYEVITAGLGKEVAEKVKAEKPDVILLDIMMPDMDGLAVCKKLRTTPEGKDIPVIFFTALGHPDLADKVAKAGGNDYIVKPFEPEVMLEKIKEVLQ